MRNIHFFVFYKEYWRENSFLSEDDIKAIHLVGLIYVWLVLLSTEHTLTGLSDYLTKLLPLCDHSN